MNGSQTMGDVKYVRLCTPSDVPEGHAKSFRVDELHVAVFHSAGRFFATAALCTHEEENLSEGWLEGEHVECPRHGAVFDLVTGEALALPATEPLQVFPVEIAGDDLKVGLPVGLLG
jgi:3-phenylpropionate/trans-cinnamate dioxygenase ferredoxin subunit